MAGSIIPVVIGPAGYIPQTPASLQQALIAGVTSTNPGYTANLPGSLIEDISSTDVYALLQSDSAIAEIISSISPYSANPFLLTQLANVYGITQGQTTNTSVYVVFSGPPGYVIPAGFTVSDGTFQYVVPDGGVIGSGGASNPLYAVATVPGSWTIPTGTVVDLVTSVPSSVSPPITVTNPAPGLPATAAETIPAFRSRVLQAGLANSQGATTFLKTLLQNIPGVQSNLVSVRSVGTQFEVLCGGGDPVQVCYAIFQALFGFNNIVGSTLSVLSITKANPAVVTTALNHLFTSGEMVTINGALGMTALNGIAYTATVIDEKTFSIPVDTTSFPTYTGGGVLTPNVRNVTQTILDYPDAYAITFVNPPQQVVTISVTWNSVSPSIVSAAAVAQLAAPALVAYVNAIVVGQPINELELIAVFQAAVSSILPPQYLSRLVFSVNINGVGTSVTAGTYLIQGDPESYFYAASNAVTVTQG